VDKALGLLGVLVFIPCVIALAAGITWLVVRLTPTKPAPGNRSTPESSS
jgi:hypothetical protein